MAVSLSRACLSPGRRRHGRAALPARRGDHRGGERQRRLVLGVLCGRDGAVSGRAWEGREGGDVGVPASISLTVPVQEGAGRKLCRW